MNAIKNTCIGLASFFGIFATLAFFGMPFGLCVIVGTVAGLGTVAKELAGDE